MYVGVATSKGPRQKPELGDAETLISRERQAAKAQRLIGTPQLERLSIFSQASVLLDFYDCRLSYLCVRLVNHGDVIEKRGAAVCVLMSIVTTA
jgi:hypothetical protein